MAVAHRLGISVDLELDRPAEASSGVFHGRDLSIDDSWLYMQPYTPEMSADEAEELIEAVGRECIANKVRLLNRAVTAIYDEALRPHELKISQMSVLVTVSVLAAPPGAAAKATHGEVHLAPARRPHARARLAEEPRRPRTAATPIYVTAACRPCRSSTPVTSSPTSPRSARGLRRQRSVPHPRRDLWRKAMKYHGHAPRSRGISPADIGPASRSTNGSPDVRALRIDSRTFARGPRVLPYARPVATGLARRPFPFDSLTECAARRPDPRAEAHAHFALAPAFSSMTGMAAARS